MNFCANGSRENVFVNLKVDGVIYFFREFLQSPFGVIDEILEVKNEDRGQFFQHRVFPRFHLGLEKEESDLSYYVKKLQNLAVIAYNYGKIKKDSNFQNDILNSFFRAAS